MGHESQIEADYFGLADAWDQELYGSLKQSRKLAWIVSGVSLGIAAMSVAAVMFMTPLKKVEPYVIMVDRTTGYSETVRKLVRDENNPLTEDEAIIIAEIAKYVTTRETFDPTDVTYRVKQIRLSTKGEEYRRFARAYTKEIENLNSESRRIVSIKSIVPDLPTKSARIRFSTELTNLNAIRTEHWIATLTYNFENLNIDMEDRYVNPLGFIVQSYRVDPESN